MNRIVSIADAIVAELNAQTWTPAFAATRAYRPIFELSDLANVQVTVVPKAIVLIPASRNVVQRDVSVDVAIQKHLSTDANSEVDALMALVDSILDIFRLRRLTTYPAAMWVKAENNPIYAPEHLETKRVFTSVVTLTYRVTE